MDYADIGRGIPAQRLWAERKQQPAECDLRSADPGCYGIAGPNTVGDSDGPANQCTELHSDADGQLYPDSGSDRAFTDGNLDTDSDPDAYSSSYANSHPGAHSGTDGKQCTGCDKEPDGREGAGRRFLLLCCKV